MKINILGLEDQIPRPAVCTVKGGATASVRIYRQTTLLKNDDSLRLAEVVRARELLKNPHYPPLSVVGAVAGRLADLWRHHPLLYSAMRP